MTFVHEMSIVLVCADAAVENAIIANALKSNGPPTPIPAVAVSRWRRFARAFAWRS